jgi:lycopene beta-cyclase
MADVLHDIAIVGAGCAGLSLAMRLAQSAPHLSVVLLDSRRQYEDDRTWCFWTSGNTPAEDLIDKRWPRWRFANNSNRSILHTGHLHHYACVRSGHFYRHSLQKITAANFKLHLDAPVSAIQASGAGIQVTAGKPQLMARQVIDTRPEPHIQAKLYQVFAGFEIETDADAFDPDEAGLMEGMMADTQGFRFIYTLPFSKRRALIELTRFAPDPIHPAQLDAELAAYLEGRNLHSARIIRQEYGLLPMGMTAKRTSEDPRIIRAGMSAGAIRAATGYAFLRIQDWAQACAASIAKGGPALPHEPESTLRSWLDAVFLTALKQKPQNGADYFLKMAKALSPDAFARFMTDAGSVLDHARLVTALPPLPFLAAAARVCASSMMKVSP